MVREIMRDEVFLQQKSVPATAEDLGTAQDLLDTLEAHTSECVGMAANMIGISKNIIVFTDGEVHKVMLNPKLVLKSGAYETEEGCLSLTGVRPCTRYKKIEVKYQDMNMKWQREKFTGWTAQIIQHECDHLQGILI